MALSPGASPPATGLPPLPPSALPPSRSPRLRTRSYSIHAGPHLLEQRPQNGAGVRWSLAPSASPSLAVVSNSDLPRRPWLNATCWS